MSNFQFAKKKIFSKKEKLHTVWSLGITIPKVEFICKKCLLVSICFIWQLGERIYSNVDTKSTHWHLILQAVLSLSLWLIHAYMCLVLHKDWDSDIVYINQQGTTRFLLTLIPHFRKVYFKLWLLLSSYSSVKLICLLQICMKK